MKNRTAISCPELVVKRIQRPGVFPFCMLAGELYDPLDPELVAARVRARDLCQQLNATREADDVVTRDIPERVFAAGNPCRVIRDITE